MLHSYLFNISKWSKKINFTKLLKPHLLHLIQAYRIIRPVVQLGRPGRLMRRHMLRLLEHATVQEIDGNPGRPEGVSADLRLDPRHLGPSLDHPKGKDPVKR